MQVVQRPSVRDKEWNGGVQQLLNGMHSIRLQVQRDRLNVYLQQVPATGAPPLPAGRCLVCGPTPPPAAAAAGPPPPAVAAGALAPASAPAAEAAAGQGAASAPSTAAAAAPVSTAASQVKFELHPQLPPDLDAPPDRRAGNRNCTVQ